ncbi:MAG: rhodanese-like domain-containing protein [Verrucomicrobia bacterium]|nr:MAG: rhodanese-like domain-containing protein [Verrucomicrobiota bacterium]
MTTQNPSGSRAARAKAVAAEVGVILVAGCLFAFAANLISKRGLNLTRDYFPGATTLTKSETLPGTNLNSLPAAKPAAATNAPTDETLRRLAAHGLTACDQVEAEKYFQQAKLGDGRVIFLDDRDDEHYAAGHIPGAYQFYHYRAEQFLQTVLPACLPAEKVIVYCNGGTCDDSENAALMLRGLGVANEKLVIYIGGIHEWESSGQPRETGERNSGRLIQGTK